jgi:ubiquinone/menaquinone biosynthesis C-methylase UbiE
VTATRQRHSIPETKGVVLHSEARYYDFMAWILTRGRERSLREKLVHLARLQPGESVLDVGCGTGTLAIAAKRHVGSSGTVHGIDASPEMIARAEKKACSSGVDVSFDIGVVEALPFPDGQFDVVLNTLMFHHLPRAAWERCARKMRRVLKPGGRVLVVDFGRRDGATRGLLSHLHRHGHVDIGDVVAVLGDAGLIALEHGAVGVNNLQYALTVAP